jgi:hypothetical protein
VPSRQIVLVLTFLFPVCLCVVLQRNAATAQYI